MKRTRVPPAIGLLAGLGLLLFLLPLAGLIIRAPWNQALGELTDPTTTTALGLSIFCSLTATAIAVVLGIPLAMILARTRGTLRNILRALTTLPMVLPPVVGGVALLLAFGRRGIAGSLLYQAFGIQIPFTTTAAVMAETFVAMPFLVIAVEAGLRSLDHRYEEAARSLGAGYWRVFTRVTLPLLRPAIFSGAVLCWARGVRGHDHVRRQLPRPHADGADRRLPGARVQARGGDHAQPHPSRRLGGDPGRDARPMAGGAVTLEASVRVRRDAFTLDVELTAAADETVAVLGPNGAGKTTLLRALAGLDEMEGRVVLDGEVLEDSARGVYVPAERRRAGLVFQDHVLFPHLSAVENVAFGLRAQGRPHAAAIARRWLSEAGLGDRADALPRALSGGQAQRVALLRALATEPKLLLLDEPLSALDVSIRAEVRRELSRQLASFHGVRLLVTHDPLEAMALADKLVVLEHGLVV